MQIFNRNNNINFQKIFAVVGTKEQVSDFNQRLKDNIDIEKTPICNEDCTQLYKDYFDISRRKGFLSQAANDGNQIDVIVTGKNHCEQVRSGFLRGNYLTRWIDNVYDLSQDICDKAFSGLIDSIIKEDN